MPAHDPDADALVPPPCEGGEADRAPADEAPDAQPDQGAADAATEPTENQPMTAAADTVADAKHLPSLADLLSDAPPAEAGPEPVVAADEIDEVDQPAAEPQDAHPDAAAAAAAADAHAANAEAAADADAEAGADADADTEPARAPGAGFIALGLPPELAQAVAAKGYEDPSPIQARAIPVLLEGRDLFGQAQTGTGKTAAFGLPLLAHMDVTSRKTQALVLAPTRELALQVAAALQGYAARLPGLRVEAVYGGQGYTEQLRALKRGAHVVVGTPGRVMDHMRRGALDLSNLSMLVLDEADEMLRMGFIDDVTWILEQTPATRQTALFSATLPAQIKRIAETSLREPETITIGGRSATAATIEQRYWVVRGMHKTDALARILEAEEHDGVLVFVRTRAATVEISEALEAKGLRAAALSGEIAQPLRERTVERFKRGHLDLLVATDVAARGLDVDRVSLVVNYDMPFDTEAYIHRIGRTGRMGRQGHAILFSAARDRRKFQAIERAVGAPLEVMQLPTVKDVNALRVKRFKERIAKTIADENLDFFDNVVREFAEETGTDVARAAAALAHMAQGDRPLLLKEERRPPRERPQGGKPWQRDGGPRPGAAGGPGGRAPREFKPRPTRPVEDGFKRFRVDVGATHGVKPGQLVGAIANEGGITGKQVGRIEIHRVHSTVDLPADLPSNVLSKLQKTRVCRRPIRIVEWREGGAG